MLLLLMLYQPRAVIDYDDVLIHVDADNDDAIPAPCCE
jgi:hypothetical protein